MTLVLTEPVNRTILLLDIEDFSRRDDVVQACLRRELHNVVEDTLAAAGVERNMQYREDRGDGLIVLVSADIPKTVLLRALLTTIPDALCQYNRLASSSAQMRLRMVLAAGEVAFDPKQGTVGGLVGHDLNQSCRLLDADALREALARQEADCVLGVSAPVYEGVVRHGHRGLRPEEFHHAAVSVKKDRLDLWLHGSLPDGTTTPVPEPASAGRGGRGAHEGAAGQSPAAPAGAPSSSGAAFAFNGGTVSVGGSQVNGGQTGVSGGHVSGDVIMGTVRHEGRSEQA
ncbi:aromatic ring-opening dioxygenase LigA [Streptomyces decoyicus]|uniref:aromatic ring-opening dioxygenase LigA n=1 Tax=Streptomyces decoyicus TaxID=249567 RepID=UPI00069D9A3B|nr:aromatic ring-opening dioxygenase LigA [Streptomyces decoyicus]KOG46043.1 aromatic ring-opening dioxygenase LigA [Streptomyces decoyicus]QZY19304.1 hypothetical protein K7C20_32165 [Streptomyces decoyicus]